MEEMDALVMAVTVIVVMVRVIMKWWLRVTFFSRIKKKIDSFSSCENSG